jgi:hypothetical protein
VATPGPTRAPKVKAAKTAKVVSVVNTGGPAKGRVHASPAFRQKIVTVANRAKKPGVAPGPSAQRASQAAPVAVRVNTVNWSMPTHEAPRVDRVPFAYIAYTPEQVTAGTDPFTQWGLVDQRTGGLGTSIGNGARLQPASGDMGPNIANVALRYTHWRLAALKVSWKPLAGSADRGKVYVIVDPTANQVQPNGPQEAIASCLQCNSAVGMEWSNSVPLAEIDNRWRNTRTTEYFGVERLEFDGPTIWLDSKGTNLPQGSVLGELEVSGVLELKCISRIRRFGSIDARVAAFTIAASTAINTTNLASGFVDNVANNRTGVSAGPSGLVLAPGVYRVRAATRLNPATYTTAALRLAGTALTFNEYNTAGVNPGIVTTTAQAGGNLTLSFDGYVCVTDAPNTNVLTLELVTTGTTNVTILASDTVGGTQTACSYLVVERIDI